MTIIETLTSWVRRHGIRQVLGFVETVCILEYDRLKKDDPYRCETAHIELADKIREVIEWSQDKYLPS